MLLKLDYRLDGQKSLFQDLNEVFYDTQKDFKKFVFKFSCFCKIAKKMKLVQDIF